MNTVAIRAEVEWEAWQSEASDRWISICHPLGVTAEGASLDELHSVIGETIHLLMLDLFEDNELEGYLQDRGWVVEGVPVAADAVRFTMPWTLSVPGCAYGSERRTH